MSDFFPALWVLLVGYGVYFALAFVATCAWVVHELRADEEVPESVAKLDW